MRGILRRFGRPLARRARSLRKRVVRAGRRLDQRTRRAWRRRFILRWRLGNRLSWHLHGPGFRRGFAERARTRRWVFVVGCSNSGTTLLARLLMAHRDVAGLPREGQELATVLPRPSDRGLGRAWSEHADAFALDEHDDVSIGPRLAHDWERRLDDPGLPVALEKSPVNSLRMRWLGRVFPRARFVAIVRDGRVVTEGISRRRAGIPLEQSARHWARLNELLLADAPHLRHFELVRYEDLVADPEGVLRHLLRFLDLDPVRHDFDFAAPVAARNLDGEPTPIQDYNARGLARLDREALAAIDPILAPMMKRLGYPTSPAAG